MCGSSVFGDHFLEGKLGFRLKRLGLELSLEGLKNVRFRTHCQPVTFPTIPCPWRLMSYRIFVQLLNIFGSFATNFSWEAFPKSFFWSTGETLLKNGFFCYEPPPIRNFWPAPSLLCGLANFIGLIFLANPTTLRNQQVHFLKSILPLNGSTTRLLLKISLKAPKAATIRHSFLFMFTPAHWNLWIGIFFGTTGATRNIGRQQQKSSSCWEMPR